MCAFFSSFSKKCLSDCCGGVAPTPNQERSWSHGMLPGSRYIPKCPEWGFSILLRCGTTPRESSWTCPIHSGRQQDLSGLLEPSFGSTQRIQHLLPGNEQCGEGEPPPTFAFSLPWGRAAVEFYKYSVACVRKKIKKKMGGNGVCVGGCCFCSQQGAQFRAYCRVEAPCQFHRSGFLFPSNCFSVSLLQESPQEQLWGKWFEKLGVLPLGLKAQ